MNAGLFVWWALVGWCGTPWRRWPPPPPPPDPWVNVINIIGGVAGGWVFSQVFPVGDTSTAIVAATTSIGALTGSVVFGNMYGVVKELQR